MKCIPGTFLALAAALLAGPARTDVIEADAHSAAIRIAVPLSVAPAQAYAAFLEIGKWWNKEHTYSGDSANLSLTPSAGGCLCESLPNGGSVLHMTVVSVMPGQRVTLSGALGPLQTAGVAGAMSFSFVPKDKGSEIVLVYNLGGYYPQGLTTIASGVNEVLAGQTDRLRRFAETGSADKAATPAPSP